VLAVDGGMQARENYAIMRIRCCWTGRSVIRGKTILALNKNWNRVAEAEAAAFVGCVGKAVSFAGAGAISA